MLQPQWGSEDVALKRGAIDASASYCMGEYSLVVLKCGHWMLQVTD